MTFHLGCQLHFARDNGAFDWICYATGSWVGCELWKRYFLYLSQIRCDLTHSSLISQTAEQIRAWTTAFSSDWQEIRRKLNYNFVRINPPSLLLSPSRICCIHLFPANQHTPDTEFIMYSEWTHMKTREELLHKSVGGSCLQWDINQFQDPSLVVWTVCVCVNVNNVITLGVLTWSSLLTLWRTSKSISNLQSIGS